ncbi:hypothetical protein [Rhodococcus aetherivorans]
MAVEGLLLKQNRKGPRRSAIRYRLSEFGIGSSSAATSYLGYRYQVEADTGPDQGRDPVRIIADLTAATLHALCVVDRLRETYGPVDATLRCAQYGCATEGAAAATLLRAARAGTPTDLTWSRKYCDHLDNLTLLVLLVPGPTTAELRRLAGSWLTTVPPTGVERIDRMVGAERLLVPHLHAIGSKPSVTRTRTLEQVRGLLDGRFDFLIPGKSTLPVRSNAIVPAVPSRMQSAVKPAGDTPAAVEARVASATERIDFTVLPAGVELSTVGREITRRSSLGHGHAPDLQRMSILDAMADYFGRERCRFLRGESSGVTYRSGTGANIDEDYLVLVVDVRNARGSRIGEDAIAISPIAGKHATFYVRCGPNAVPWTEIFSYPKKQATALGARRLTFKCPPGLDPYRAMRERLIALANCRSADFHDKAKRPVHITGTYRYKIAGG